MPHAVEQLSLCATTTEPALQSPQATTTEAWVPRAHALQPEKTSQWEARTRQWRTAPIHLNQRKPECGNKDPHHSQK